MKAIFIFISFCVIFVSCRQADDQLLHKAFDLSKQKKYTDAIDVYTQAIEKDNKLQLAFYNRGCCYTDIENYAKALADFDTVMSLLQTTDNSNVVKPDVSYNEALYQRAQIYFYMDSVKNSFRDFQILVDANYKEKCNCILWQAAIWMKAGESEKACEYFNKAKAFAFSPVEKQRSDSMITTYCLQPKDTTTLKDSSAIIIR